MKKTIAAILAVLIAFVCFNIAQNQSFGITRYTVRSPKLTSEFKGVLFADLHEAEFGENNSELLSAIREEKPDAIFLAGDIVSNTCRDFSKLVKLLDDLSDIAPVYYAFGNHEYGLDLHGYFNCEEEINALENVTLFRYGAKDVEINGNNVRIGGMSVDMDGWENYGKKYFELYENKDTFFILMSHYPWLIPEYYPDTTADVVLSGHAHGGQFHLMNDVGLYVPNYGWFPKLTSGIHNIKGTTEIVTRGLGDHTIIPRINNRPELVVIDFVPAKGE